MAHKKSKPKKSKSKNKRSSKVSDSMMGPSDNDMLRYQAEDQVRRAFMETPAAKGLVDKAVDSMKSVDRAVKRSVNKKVGKQ